MAAPGGAAAAALPPQAPLPHHIPNQIPHQIPGPPPFPAWLAARLDALGLDRAVYGAYIEGLLREEESDEERLEALRAVLAACLEEDLLNDVCQEVVEKWSDSQVVDAKEEKEDEVQAIASMMEKQARIVVKPKEVSSQEEKQRKAALLAQYANVTDEEDGGDDQDGSTGTAVNIGSEKSSQNTLTDKDNSPSASALFRNTNVEDVLNARKLERELLRDEFQRKKEQDKLQREKDKLAKQERKEKEKKRTQKGERKR